MARYRYKAKKGVDEVVEGVLEADNEAMATDNLFREGLYPIEIVVEETSETRAAAEKIKKQRRRLELKIRRRITQRDVLTFTQKLAILIRAKVELLPSLKILYEQTESGLFKDVIVEIYNLTKEGKMFSESLQRFPKLFSGLYIAMINSGEVSGRLDTALGQICDFMNKKESLKNKILVAMAYPALLLSVGLVSIFVLVAFVIPRLAPIFTGLGKELPLITKIVLNISLLSNKVWFLILGVMVLVGALLYYKKDLFAVFARKVCVHLPVINRLLANQELAYFSKGLTLLLNSGVPALKSLEVAAPAIENPTLRSAMKKVCQEVSAGKSISKSMEANTTLPGFFVKMIAVGEETGRLGEVLDEVSTSFIQQIESDIALVSSLIEPVLIIGLGLVLGTIVLSVLLPTFQVTQMVH